MTTGCPSAGIEEYWETPQTLNETWGYSAHDHQWKQPAEVIRRLVEIVSRGGNYLLNIGPDGEGVIPPPSVDILHAVGKWMRDNQASIYGTTASPFQELPWGHCTVKGQTLFLHVFHWPASGQIELPGLQSKVDAAQLLVDATALQYRQERERLVISLPAAPVDDADTVVQVTLAEPLRVTPPVIVQTDGKPLLLDYVRHRHQRQYRQTLQSER